MLEHNKCCPDVLQQKFLLLMDLEKLRPKQFPGFLFSVYTSYHGTVPTGYKYVDAAHSNNEGFCQFLTFTGSLSNILFRVPEATTRVVF